MAGMSEYYMPIGVKKTKSIFLRDKLHKERFDIVQKTSKQVSSAIVYMTKLMANTMEHPTKVNTKQFAVTMLMKMGKHDKAEAL
mmetsp:Transcript_12628/g.18141  ORF Transcript_12628/g.18141 Transcript_12628/m.18141 type:complete len:84 (-) Transcript_12628:82-333(-)